MCCSLPTHLPTCVLRRIWWCDGGETRGLERGGDAGAWRCMFCDCRHGEVPSLVTARLSRHYTLPTATDWCVRRVTQAQKMHCHLLQENSPQSLDLGHAVCIFAPFVSSGCRHLLWLRLCCCCQPLLLLPVPAAAAVGCKALLLPCESLLLLLLLPGSVRWG